MSDAPSHRTSPRDHRRSRIPDVHLIPCHQPKGELDRAPRSALCENSASESWDGFWCEERYYTRRTRRDGTVRWFTIVDSRPQVLKFVPRGSTR